MEPRYDLSKLTDQHLLTILANASIGKQRAEDVIKQVVSEITGRTLVSNAAKTNNEYKIGEASRSVNYTF